MFRETVLHRTIELIEEQYPFPDMARVLVERLCCNPAKYDLATTDRQFAEMVSRDLKEITNDPHLWLQVRQKTNRKLRPVAETRLLKLGIAVIKITRFPSTNSPKGKAAVRELNQAFSMAAHATAIIIDIRSNEGGDGSSVALATSYLLPARSQRLVIYRLRPDLPPQESWTLEQLPNETAGTSRPLADKPLVILVSKKTFSAAEEFAYTLQQMGRAVIIGEQTRGGAHPSKRHIIEDTFILSLPFAETISPITHANWEGIGVIPDILCPAKTSLKIAKEHLTLQLTAGTIKPRKGRKTVLS